MNVNGNTGVGTIVMPSFRRSEAHSMVASGNCCDGTINAGKPLFDCHKNMALDLKALSFFKAIVLRYRG